MSLPGCWQEAMHALVLVPLFLGLPEFIRAFSFRTFIVMCIWPRCAAPRVPSCHCQYFSSSFGWTIRLNRMSLSHLPTEAYIKKLTA